MFDIFVCWCDWFLGFHVVSERRGVTITVCSTARDFLIWIKNTHCIPVFRFYSLIVFIDERLIGDKAIPGSAELRLESFYSPIRGGYLRVCELFQSIGELRGHTSLYNYLPCAQYSLQNLGWHGNMGPQIEEVNRNIASCRKNGTYPSGGH